RRISQVCPPNSSTPTSRSNVSATSPAGPRTGAKRKPALNAFKGGFAVLLTLVAWLIFAPLNLGGAFAYVYVHGNSMAPHLQNGDVVLLRSAEHYGVGDVVAVRNPDIGLVLHRIVADDGEHLTVQGDNRKTPDNFRPTMADITAKEWLHVGGFGSVLEKLQQPVFAAAIGGGVLLLMLAGFLAK